MFSMPLLLKTLWFIWMLKYVLFWLYLWQLKNYHIGRFIDHFRTHKGKKLLISLEQVLKLALLVFLFLTPKFFNQLILVLFLIYFAGDLIFARNIYLRNFKKPVLTFKTAFLGLVSFLTVVIFLVLILNFSNLTQFASLLIFDILTPLVVSLIVLIFQPIFVVVRKNILKKAGEKLEKIKLLSGLKVIAITGSYGKTTTKEFLTTILSKKFKVLSTKEHQNSEIGIAKCIQENLKPSHQIFIAEVGAYNKGKVKEVCNMLKPNIGIVTGVNHQHMALFGSFENLLSAEGGGELAQSLQKDGLLIVNGDNKYCLDLVKKTIGLRKKIYTTRKNVVESDIWTEDIFVEKNSISFVAVCKNKEMSHFKINVLGKQNAQNLLAAILVARELGMNIEEISEACKSIKQEQAGMGLTPGKHDIDIIDSSYSANPDGVFADLEYLSIFPKKKIIVMPCLIELGSKSSEIHKKIGRKIGKVCHLAIITSRDKFKEIEAGFNETKNESAKCLLCDKPDEIATIISLFCKAGDVVLLEGRAPSKLLKLLGQ